METRSSFRQQKKQTRLSFQPLSSSSPAKDSYSDAVQSRLANVRFEGSRSSPRVSQRHPTIENSAPLPTPEPSSQPPADSKLESSLGNYTPLKPSAQENACQLAKPNDGEEQTEEDEIIIPSSKRRKTGEVNGPETPTRKSARLREIATPRSDLSPQLRRKQNAIPSSPPIRRSLSIGSPETSGDEQVTLFTQGTSRRRSTRPTRVDDDFVTPDDESEDTRARPIATTRSRKTDQNAFVVGDDEIEYISSDENDAIPTRRRKKSKTKRSERSRKIQDELDDDLRDLQDSDGSDIAEIGRTRGGPVTTQRDRNREHFELLKRRRAGEPIPRIADSDESDPGLDEDDGVDIEQITRSTRMSYSRGRIPTERSDLDNEEDSYESQAADYHEDGVDNDDDFIVQDETHSSTDARAGIPLAFTSFASRKPRELFIHVVEWLVKNKIAPAFSRDDELYVLSWNKINDQIKAQAGSRLISAAWNEDFKNAVLARPEMQVHLVTDGSDEFFLNCDACNRTNHPARYKFKLTGQAYHEDTLEPIDNDEDSNNEGDDADDSASYDQQGHLLPSAHRTYYLGRFCAAHAEMGHKLTHWRYHLNQSLLTYLEEQGVLSAEAIVAREKLNKKKREKEAENIVDLMQETGMIDQMWRGLQDDLEDARYGMEDHVAKGGKRNQQRIGTVRVHRGGGDGEERSEDGQMQLVIPDDSEGE